jgi:Rad3-related DNA helicase
LFFHLKRTPLNASEGTDFGDTIVLDEAHHLMSKARSIFGYKVSNKQAVLLLGKDAARRDGEKPSEWITRLLMISTAELKRETDLKSVPALNTFNLTTSFICQFEIDDQSKFFIDDRGEEVEIKPVDFRYLKNIIFYPFKRILLLSATFASNFCDVFGISENEIEIIDIPSTFPVKNRPIYWVKDLPALNYKSELSKEHPTIQALDKILSEYKSEKGIIHCSNYAFFRQLKKLYRKNTRFIWVEQGDDKAKHLTKHAKSSVATVLVSPSMLEGVDLKDDMARFQVMLKLPYPALDDYTKRMMAIYNGYYENEVATSIMQAYGRAVRSEEDHAKFYILDGSFYRFAGKRELLSQYFMEACVTITTKSIGDPDSVRTLK